MCASPAGETGTDESVHTSVESEQLKNSHSCCCTLATELTFQNVSQLATGSPPCHTVVTRVSLYSMQNKIQQLQTYFLYSQYWRENGNPDNQTFGFRGFTVCMQAAKLITISGLHKFMAINNSAKPNLFKTEVVYYFTRKFTGTVVYIINWYNS